MWPSASEQAAAPDPAPETTRAEFERRARPLREKPATGRRPSPLRGSESPGPLSRGAAAQSDVTTARPALILVGAALAVVAVLAFAATRLAGRSGSSAPATATPGAATRTAGGGSPVPATSNQPRATQPPPARRAGSMPNLVGKDAKAALQQLQQVGVNPLVITLTSPNKNDAPGVVLRQTPAPGTTLNTSSGVTLFVSAGGAASTPTVP
jgi:hypothetical protein